MPSAKIIAVQNSRATSLQLLGRACASFLPYESGDIDPSFVVTHPASLEDAPAMYKKFRDKEDGVIEVVLRPGR